MMLMVIGKNKLVRARKEHYENKRDERKYSDRYNAILVKTMWYIQIGIMLHLLKPCGTRVNININEAEAKVLKQILINKRTYIM